MKTLLLDVKEYHKRSPIRYKDWRDAFGKHNFAIIYPEDLEHEIETGNKAKVHYFNENLETITIKDHGISCDLFLAREFVDNFGSLPDLSKINKIMSYVEKLNKKGKIKKMVNSKKGTLNQKDKLTDLSLKKDLGVIMPETFHFSNYEKFKDFIYKSDKSYILKHRFGADGFNIEKINREYIESFKKINLENYLIQEEMDINYETRIIILNGEFLGARKIIDRTRPWEKKGKRKHECIPYNPSNSEVEESKKILNYLDIFLGCVDWISVGEKGNLYYLETNGVATGYGGYKDAPYNLNKEVAFKLMEYTK